MARPCWRCGEPATLIGNGEPVCVACWEHIRAVLRQAVHRANIRQMGAATYKTCLSQPHGASSKPWESAGR